MITKRCIIIKFCLINCVVGIINVNNVNTTVAESNLIDLEVKINKTLNEYVSNILDSFLTYIDDKTDALSQKIPELEQKITQQLNATNKNIEQNIELKINQTLNASTKQTEENLFEKITQMLNASNTKILDAEEKITQSIIASNTKVDLKLEEIKRELLENKRIASAQLPCKELSFVHDGVSQYYSIDSDTLNHVTLKRNSTGHLQYFEMHFAIEADGWVEILLSQNESSTDASRYKLSVGYDSNRYTRLEYSSRRGGGVGHTPTPSILSSTRFRDFYIIIDPGNLEFGKEGDVSSLVSNHDACLAFVNYFRFKLNGSAAKVRYDCPAPIRELPLPCKEVSVVDGGSTRYYSMDSDILNHVTLKRNSFGHLAYFEMHFVINGNGHAVIELLSDRDNYWDASKFTLWLGDEDNKSTVILKYNFKPVKQVRTANNIISSTQSRAFYIKIDNGNLQFGKEGDSSPLLSHDDARLGLLNFFQLNMWNGSGKILYDCPAPVNGSS